LLILFRRHSPVSRHRFCPSNDRDGFIEELAQELWEEKQADGVPWAEADAELRQHYLNLAADTLRFLEHGHG
jgi:hypothetical protein